ncbi:helix-turn-helix domain-containing protein [Asticcacaulis sp. DXS10W]|uniref:Helix-turn-helix domain-containing protein n=1 Tax=Asticcacaulis currens TaxID=2984210 RepID=A0ABT5IF53_9CAUL|nr:helix-turn-helix domain-containing protein [Asticcacaulis currens]MDC7694822.1 helix-turn-helix domain-containing protein [Asticcacaulis currens]
MSELLNTVQAASRLNLSPSTLNKARLTGDGPRFVKLGTAVRYRPEDLDAWVSGQVRKSTSDTTGEA